MLFDKTQVNLMTFFFVFRGHFDAKIVKMGSFIFYL